MRFRSPSSPSPLHFRRIEVKYLLPERLIGAFLARIAPYTEVDPFLVAERRGQTSYPVTSLYFDSVDLHSLAEKDAGLLARRKLRLRTYAEAFAEDIPAFLEIKRRHDFVVSKDRLSLAIGHLRAAHPMEHLLAYLLHRVEARADVTAEAQVLRGFFNLQPTAIVAYHRIPSVAKHDRRFRITVDTDLSGMWQPPTLFEDLPLRRCFSGYAVVEFKFHHAIPPWCHAVLQDFNLVRTAFSKYAMVVCALRWPFSFSSPSPFFSALSFGFP